jgi:replicative DNA helicase
MDFLRVPPHSIDAEQAVLGGLMLSATSWDRISAIVCEDDFYRRDHQLIFRAIVGLIDRGQPCDAVTLGEWIESQGVAEEIGGMSYVIHLASTTPSAANVRAYAEIVRDKAMLRRLVDAGTNLANSAYNADGRTAAEILDAAIGGMMTMQRRDTRAEWGMREVLRMAFDRVRFAYEHQGTIPGVPTGLEKLDEHMGGLHPSDLTVIGARPSMGKTALLFGMAKHAAAIGHPVGIISGEQPAVQLGMRMLALSSKVQSARMRSGHVSDDDWEAITNAIAKDAAMPMHVYDKSAPHISEAMRVARRWKREHGVKAIYVDYLQRLDGPGERAYERVSAVAKGLKNIARELDIPVVALAQVKREVELRADKRPRMSDLCDSSEIEKEADQIITLYRDDYYHDGSPDAGTAELLIDKNRHGECAKVRVAWIPQTMQFANLDHAWTPIANNEKPAGNRYQGRRNSNKGGRDAAAGLA